MFALEELRARASEASEALRLELQALSRQLRCSAGALEELRMQQEAWGEEQGGAIEGLVVR